MYVYENAFLYVEYLCFIKHFKMRYQKSLLETEIHLVQSAVSEPTMMAKNFLLLFLADCKFAGKYLYVHDSGLHLSEFT